MWSGFRRQAAINSAESFLAHWTVMGSATGDLTFQLRGPVMTFDIVLEAATRILPMSSDLATPVVFDLSAVESIESPATTVFAVFVRLARSIRGGCRLIGLDRQPAALASLLHRELRGSNVICEGPALRQSA